MAETDDLVTRLLANGLDECDEAADRIMQLECLARGQEEQLEIQGNELARRASHGHKLAARIEALTAENERLGGLFDDLCHFPTQEGRASHMAKRLVDLEGQRDAKEAKLAEIRNLQAAPEGWDEVYATRALINGRAAAIARAEAAEAALKDIASRAHAHIAKHGEQP